MVARAAHFGGRWRRAAGAGGAGAHSEADDRQRALPRLRELAQPISNPVLGSTGNSTIAVQELPDGRRADRDHEAGLREKIGRSAGQSIEVIRRRVDETGTKEPQIQRQGLDRILVQVPASRTARRSRPASADGEAGIPSGRRTGRQSERYRGVDDQENPAAGSPSNVCHGAGRRSHLGEAAFDSRNGQPVVIFRFNVRARPDFGA